MKAHFIGICGAGMSAVAKLLKDSGWSITGSDEGFYPPVSTYLQENKIPCVSHYAASNIPKDADVIVIGKHAKLVPEENEEVKAAFDSGIAVKSFPEILQKLTLNKHNYVVAGSFGKSTCVTLTAWILTHAGKDPSYFIGAIPLDLPSNAHVGKGESFVLEGDEYPSANWDETSKFMYYNASTILVTSCEHDHVNVYPTVDDYLKPFVALLTALPSDSPLIACLDGENVATVLEQSSHAATTYSFANTEADWYAANVTRKGMTTSFDLMSHNQKIATLETSLLGDHNIQNIVGVSAWLLTNNAITPAELTAAVQAFTGVKRRMELKTPHSKLPVYEDFGSSRAKAIAGITTVRKQFPNKRIIVLFEPHTFSWRNRASLPWYDDLFDQVDSVYVYQPPTHGAGTHEQLTLEEIVARIKATGKEVYGVNTKEELMSQLTPILNPDSDLILIETSGDLGGAIEAITEHVKNT